MAVSHQFIVTHVDISSILIKSECKFSAPKCAETYSRNTRLNLEHAFARTLLAMIELTKLICINIYSIFVPNILFPLYSTFKASQSKIHGLDSWSTGKNVAINFILYMK